MKIKFLGTSAAWPLPRLECKCEICTSKDPKDTRTRTQILIDGKVLFDAGPDTYHHLKKEDLSRLEAIFISHEHPDHTFGLWDLPHVYGRKETGLNQINLYIAEETLNGIGKVFNPPHKVINVTVVKPNQPISVGDSKVTYIPVIHGNVPAYAIKCENKKTFTYITDFNQIPPESEKFIKNSDIVAFDGASLTKIGQTPGHISIADGIQIAKKLNAKSTYFVHPGHKTGTHTRLESFLAKNATPNFHIAFDGLEVSL